MTTLRRAARSIVPLALLLALAGCGGGAERIVPFGDTIIDVACPPMGGLKQAESFTRFRPGQGRDLTDVAFTARIGRVAGKCEVNQDEVVATVAAGIELFAERGPALEGVEVPVEYFIAIRAPNGAIASRQAFTLPLDFSTGAREARAVDYLTFKIPNATPEALRAYRIYFGLQMTREEWAFTERARQPLR
mgnify:CR=1 FL=1|jgi:hypothetical protein